MFKAGVCLLCLLAASSAAAGGEDRLAAANTAFALDLYQNLGQGNGNLAIAPLSVSTALGLTLGGAGGETEAQMTRALHFDSMGEDLHGTFASLRERLRDVGHGEWSTADALWGQAGEGFREEFLNLAAENYAAGFHEVDFARDAGHARRTINAWMEVQTGERVRELLRRGDVDGETALVVTSAVRFRAGWASRFDPRSTREGAFRTPDGGEAIVPFMHQAGRFLHARDGDLQVLDLPYEGGRLSMTIFLPSGGNGLQRLESSLTRKNLDRWLGLLAREPVQVTLPRFRLESRSDLSGALRTLGMTDAFDDRRADFSGINGRRNLFLSLVAHGASIEVDERGTEAAGGTAAVLQKRGAPPAGFHADRPFLFLIRDNETGSILFMGRVTDPRS